MRIGPYRPSVDAPPSHHSRACSSAIAEGRTTFAEAYSNRGFDAFFLPDPPPGLHWDLEGYYAKRNFSLVAFGLGTRPVEAGW